ncbi:DUF429 domain-containing protein [Stella sp.]|uniref:DUF429 domain-containing protein n=1 Tax=Stella sp. TaxID=2912054 RepID=UPI0035B4A6FB
MILAGIDGSRGGWIAVLHDRGAGTWRTEVAACWTDLPAADRLAVDMPIGLPDGGRRGCDFAARRLLGPRRGASVFIGLRRPLLGFRTYAEANAWAKADGAGLAKQAWFLLPKIREIDRAVAPEDQDRIHECHPELAFLRLGGGPIAESKRTPEGLAIRRALLEDAGVPIASLLAGLDRRRAAPDDLLDAAALALTAGRIADGQATCLAAAPPRDARGLRMEIWY